MLSVRDCIDVKGPEHKRVVYKRLRALVEGFIGRVKSRLGFGRLFRSSLANTMADHKVGFLSSRLGSIGKGSIQQTSMSKHLTRISQSP